MNYSIKILTIICCLLFLNIGCKENNTTENSSVNTTSEETVENDVSQQRATNSNEENKASSNYSDGEYCATIQYMNSSTRRVSNYTLPVEVADGRLIEIHWTNGGWLDNSHFNPPLISDNGYASFTSDRGYKYQIVIQGEGPCPEYKNDDNSTQVNSEDDNANDNSGLSADEIEEQQIGKDEAVVVKRIEGCDYFIAENNRGYIILEWMHGKDPDEGDKIRGVMNAYGRKDYYIINRGRTSQLWLEDYSLSEDDALEKLKDKCN